MSSTPQDSGSDTENESENSVKEEVEQWDPEAKPVKGILKKEGSSRKEKKDEHIQLQADEGKDAEKKRRNTNPIPVEGVKGIVMKGNNNKNQISNKEENEKKNETNDNDEKKSTKGDEKVVKDKKSSKEKNKEENCTIS